MIWPYSIHDILRHGVYDLCNVAVLQLTMYGAVYSIDGAEAFIDHEFTQVPLTYSNQVGYSFLKKCLP